MEKAGWPALLDLAAGQHGLATRQQIEAALSRRAFDRRVAEGVLTQVGRGVWRVGAVPVTWRQRVMAACLSVGPPVAASHHSAAELWRIEEVARQRIHLTVPRQRGGGVGKALRAAGIVVHRAELPPESVTQRYRIPVTTLPRTLVDLAGALSTADGLLATIADGLDRRRLLDLDALRRERERRRPVAGGQVVDGLLERWVADKGEKGGRSDSDAEVRLYAGLVDAGLPIPAKQYEVCLPGGGLARLDLAYPLQRVGVEFDGFAFHKGREAFDHDRARMAELAALDWLILPVTSTDRADDVIRRVRGALLLRGWDPP
ncbi:MAG TPA: type IV toxin-antitoxin system AbiEi family antitoxin domain-containing protein [Acidimicrobiales bacterium]|nr:type IV toxin-antitoxin system AbiEi family antitoxin domain-containing protein [Acidimicrobiales bacterium]